jgi:hypothetical protein
MPEQLGYITNTNPPPDSVHPGVSLLDLNSVP